MSGLRIVKNLQEKPYQRGYKVWRSPDSVIMFGISPRNSFYSTARLQQYFEYFAEHGNLVAVLVVGSPVLHTFRALGRADPERSAKRCLSKVNGRIKCALEALDNDAKERFTVISWADVEADGNYQLRLKLLREEFNRGGQLTEDACKAATCVLENNPSFMAESESHMAESVKEAAQYVVEELPMLDFVHEMFRAEICDVYNKCTDIVKYCSGAYDGESKDWSGNIVLEPDI